MVCITGNMDSRFTSLVASQRSATQGPSYNNFAALTKGEKSTSIFLPPRFSNFKMVFSNRACVSVLPLNSNSDGTPKVKPFGKAGSKYRSKLSGLLLRA